MIKTHVQILNKINSRSLKLEQLKESLSFYNSEYKFSRSPEAQTNRYKVITKIYKIEKEILKLQNILNNF